MTAAVIGVAGGSSCGKSSLSGLLASVLGASVFCLDDYWISGAPRPLVNGVPSCERPDQYDGRRMASDIAAHLAAEGAAPVVAEGFLVMLYPELFNLMSVRLFVAVPDQELMSRRISRARKVGGSSRDPWIENGLDEWRRYGACQQRLDGVTTLDGELPGARLSEQVVSLLAAGHGQR